MASATPELVLILEFTLRAPGRRADHYTVAYKPSVRDYLYLRLDYNGDEEKKIATFSIYGVFAKYNKLFLHRDDGCVKKPDEFEANARDIFGQVYALLSSMVQYDKPMDMDYHQFHGDDFDSIAMKKQYYSLTRRFRDLFNDHKCVSVSFRVESEEITFKCDNPTDFNNNYISRFPGVEVIVTKIQFPFYKTHFKDDDDEEEETTTTVVAAEQA